MTLRLTPAEIDELTPGLILPAAKLRELHRRGYWRAWIARDRSIVLERAHVEAVAAGALPPGARPADTGRPQLRPVAQRKAA